MCKLLRMIVLCAMLWGAFQMGGVIRDRQTLSEDVIRLHVVANSDSEEDQALKLQVRDAVLSYLEQAMGTFEDPQAAKAYLQERLGDIQRIATQVVQAAGLSDAVTVSLTQETFDTREYETFTLPAGIYESLRIVIGEGQGHNWWCVVFPGLCSAEEPEEFASEAAGAGFSDTLTQTVQKEEEYEIRFWILDLFGKVQNFFWGLR